jgi:glycosyltransferase involved in cell wall biosynthesis
VPKQKIRVLYNTVNPFFAKAVEAPALDQGYNLTGHGAPLLLTVARIKSSEHAKGYDVILGLLPQLLHRFPQLMYVLAGPCEAAEQERVIKLATSLGVQQRLVFTGDVPTIQLPGLYTRCQVFAMPSTKEGFGIVYLEAALCGCQVVAYYAGGAPEALLHGKLGYLAQQGDTAGLLKALIDALENPLSTQEKATRKKMVEEHYGFGNFTRSIAQHIQQLF